MPASISEALAPMNWPGFAYVLTRVTGLMMVTPLWSLPGVPGRIRAAVALVLTLALLPAAPPVTLPHLSLVPVALGMELVIGLAIGLSAAVIMSGVSMAGEVVALQMGLSMGPALSPMTEDQVPGVGQLTGALALLVYLALDGHLVLLRGLAETLKQLPPGTAPHFESLPEVIIRLVGMLYSVAIRVAAPAMAALFVVNLAVGLTGRAVPQFPALMVVFPITIAVGLVMLHLALPGVAGTIAGWVSELPLRCMETIAALRGQP